MIKRSSLFLLVLAFLLNFGAIQAQDTVSDLLGRINNLRASLGLSAYSLNGALSAAALNHAQWMASTGEVTHTQYDGSRPVDRAQANGYSSSWVAENIYMGPIAGVDDAWTFWINSSVHYAGLTSTNFQDVGIASVRGEYGQAFVLVFGNPGGRVNPVNSSGGGGGNSGGGGAEVPQYAILGFDAFGNVRYQLQEGETLGDVLLIFGYTWDDLPALMSLNNFTEEDVRSLDVGQEILVPSHEGTWTPSAPNAEASAEVTEPAAEAMGLSAAASPTFDVSDLSPTATLNSSGILPTPSGSETGILPTPLASESLILPSPTMADEQIAPPEVFVLASPSPNQNEFMTVQMSATPEATGIAMAATIAPSSTPLPESPPAPGGDNGIPLWLIGAIVVQLGVLGFAGIEFLRRMGKA